MLENLAQYAPEHNQIPWLMINLGCFLFSIFLLVDLLLAKSRSSERLFAAAFYIVYNWVTTVIWCVEISFRMIWEKVHAGKHGWDTLIEFLLAIFFLGDSIRLIFIWELKGQDIKDEAWDAIVNALSYLFIAIWQLIEISKQETLIESYTAIEENSETV